MDVEKLKARVAAARRFDHTIDGVRFTLETPTEHALRVHTARARAGNALDTGTLMVLVSRAMLIEAVCGWDGVTTAHFLPEAEPEAVAFEASLVADLVDAQPLWAAELVTALYERLGQRRSRIEAAQKNS